MGIISTFLPLVKDLLAPITVGGDPPSLIPTSKFYPGHYLIPHPPMGQKSILKFYLALVLLVCVWGEPFWPTLALLGHHSG